MAQDPDDLVILMTCGSQFEASAMRELLGSGGVFCHVQGEHHGSLLGAMPIIAANLMVRRRDVERADELITAYRTGRPYVDHPFRGEITGQFPEEDGDDDSEEEDDDEEGEDEEDTAAAPDVTERRLAAARSYALFPGFGAGSFYARAYAGGVLFAAAEIAGIYLLFQGAALAGVALIACAVLFDRWSAARAILARPRS